MVMNISDDGERYYFVYYFGITIQPPEIAILVGVLHVQ